MNINNYNSNYKDIILFMFKNTETQTIQNINQIILIKNNNKKDNKFKDN